MQNLAKSTNIHQASRAESVSDAFELCPQARGRKAGAGGARVSRNRMVKCVIIQLGRERAQICLEMTGPTVVCNCPLQTLAEAFEGEQEGSIGSTGTGGADGAKVGSLLSSGDGAVHLCSMWEPLALGRVLIILQLLCTSACCCCSQQTRVWQERKRTDQTFCSTAG